jgi:hypothetical protein
MKEQVTFRSRPLSRRRFLGATSQAALTMLAGARLSRAAAAKPGSGYDDSPAKDRVTMVTWYEPDPSWPQKPAGYTWGAGSGVAVDAGDRVWIFTRSSPAVQVYGTDGEFLFAWDSEPWRTKKLKTPHYLRIDPEQNVWLCDVGRHVIHKCTQAGKLLMTLGTMDEPGQPLRGQDPEHFNKPTDVAVTAGGDIYISDGYVNSRVVHYDAKGRFVKQWGTQGIRPGEFNVVHSIAVDSAGRLYVADRSNARVQVFDNAGRFLAEWRDVIVPWGIWITGSDEIWVCGSWAGELGSRHCTGFQRKRVSRRYQRQAVPEVCQTFGPAGLAGVKQLNPGCSRLAILGGTVASPIIPL